MKRSKLLVLLILIITLSACHTQDSTDNLSSYSSDIHIISSRNSQIVEIFEEREERFADIDDEEYTWSEKQIYINNLGEEVEISLLPPREEMIIPESQEDEYIKYFPNAENSPDHWGSATLFYPNGDPVWEIGEFLKYNSMESPERDINLIPQKWREEILKMWAWDQNSPKFGLYLIEGYPVISIHPDLYRCYEAGKNVSDSFVLATSLGDYNFFYSNDSMIRLGSDDNWLYIKDDVLYNYSERLARGTKLIATNLKTGEEIYRYSEIGGMIAMNEIQSTIPSVNNLYDLYEFMLDISDIWYRI